ncbi:MAG: imidazolonepropionase [Bradymonadales bacterium]|nr:imidazolonepropionase [Bradymonadales bacterium]
MSEVNPTKTGRAMKLPVAGAQALVVRANQLLTMCEELADASDPEAIKVGLIPDGAVWIDQGKIKWVGRFASLPHQARPLPVRTVPLAMPALVECHTHALYWGSRHQEFAIRNAGGSYAEILEAGGGILSTVSATATASDEELKSALLERLELFRRKGCALVEVKSGYGLSHEEEIRHLRLMREVQSVAPVAMVVTYLGAHALPPRFKMARHLYVDEIVERSLPQVVAEGLADAVDVFCDRGAFTADEARRILTRGRELGLACRIHTDELSHSGGCQVAHDLRASSADHLDYAENPDLDLLARADVAAVLFPGVTVFLDPPHRPRARAMVAKGVRIALSTDYNPGSSHTQDLMLMATLGCTLFKLTPAEALRGITRVPAEVLGKAEQYGRLSPGSAGCLLAAQVPSFGALPYHMAAPELLERIGY